MPTINDLRSAVRHEGGVTRRLFLASTAALAGLPWRAAQGRAAQGAPVFSTDPFTLGIASGDPDDTSVVLWTRLAPQSFDPDGGMGSDLVEVRWELAEDDAMRRVVQTGTATAGPLLGHSVHAEVSGLQPDRWYWFRFRAGAAESPIGRTRTLPAPDARPDRLRFAFASCQHYEQGYFTAYRPMVADDLDMVVFLGDYIDRGPQSRGVVSYLVELPKQLSSIEFVFLKGNHEDMFLSFL